MSRTVIAIEGIPGSGKTSLQNLLSKELNLFPIPEIAPEMGDIPDEHDRQQEWFWQNDLKKISQSQKHERSILDRNYVSTLGYNWSIPNNDLQFKKVLSWYLDQVDKNDKPHLYIYLDAPVQTGLDRKNRLTVGGQWGDRSFLDNYKKFYDLFFSLFEKETPVVRLDASLPLKEILSQALDIIKKYDKFK